MSDANNTTEPGTPIKRNRSKLVLVILFGLFLLPPLAAWVLTSVGWLPEGTKNHGTLVVPPRKLPEQLVLGTQELDMASYWTLLTVSDGGCDQACRDNLLKLRQVRLAQGRRYAHVKRGLITRNPPDAELRQVLAVYDDMPAGLPAADQADAVWQALDGIEGQAPDGRVFLVDRRANIMMVYPADQEPKGMIRDLERLLKNAPPR